MARRSAPANSGPQYISQPQRRQHTNEKSDETAFGRFMREQIWAPEKLPGNLSIVTGVGMFVGGILAVRTWGELMVPA